MKRGHILALIVFFVVLFSFAIFMLLWGVPQITSNSVNPYDSLSAIIASIVLAIFSGSGLLIILNSKL